MGSVKEQAFKLRDDGYSYSMIRERLGVPISTMSYWFKGRLFLPNKEVLSRIKTGPAKSAHIKRQSKIALVELGRQAGLLEVGQLSKRDIMMLGIGLYVGEGAKSIESIRIMNSDPRVIKFSIRWFKEVCGLAEENIIISMFLYPDNDELASKEYWKQITNLQDTNFRRTTIDRRLNKRTLAKGKLPYGTIQLRIKSNGNKDHGVALFRKIMGWIEGALQDGVV